MEPWLDELRGRLPRHAALIDGLLDLCDRDARIRVLELQCSVARGAGDELSDLDMGVAATESDWEAVAADLPDRLRSLADCVEVHSHTIPEWGGRAHRRLFVQYADGRQLDVVVQPVTNLGGRVPGAIVLYDPDGHLERERRVPSAVATGEDVAAWERLGWELLANLAKYIARGSAWEALERLGQARDMALRLWAAAESVPYPVFGLTSLLDADPPRLPAGLDATVAGLDLAELTEAGRACAALLRTCADAARAALTPGATSSPMGAYVEGLLRFPRSTRGTSDAGSDA